MTDRPGYFWKHVASPSTTNTAWTDTDLKIVSVIKDNLAVTDEKWTEHWYGGVVPWWYVQAVLTKFGGGLKLKTNTTTSVRLDVEEEWVDELGYHLKANECASTDISVLTSSICYEKKVQRKSLAYFTILTPTKDGHAMKVHWTGWYYNYLNDLPKSSRL